MSEYVHTGQSNPAKKFQIKTFTGRYIPVEDRLRIDAVDAGCNKQSFFMTRRLTDKVISVMAEYLEAQTPGGMPRALVLEMQQDKARQKRAQSASEVPVEAETETVPRLCRVVHLTKTRTCLLVVFALETDTEVQMPMTADNLRTVLDILQTLYTSADWGHAAFPDWMKSPEKTDTPRQLN